MEKTVPSYVRTLATPAPRSFFTALRYRQDKPDSRKRGGPALGSLLGQTAPCSMRLYVVRICSPRPRGRFRRRPARPPHRDRKSTRLNSSHTVISYAVFCLKKKKNNQTTITLQQKKQKQN